MVEPVANCEYSEQERQDPEGEVLDLDRNDGGTIPTPKNATHVRIFSRSMGSIRQTPKGAEKTPVII